MKPITIQWLLDVLPEAQVVNVNDSIKTSLFSVVNTDSRTIEPGQVFLALKGPNFNGEAFVEQVKEKGAVLAIVSQPIESNIPQIVVADTKLAYGLIAKANAQKANVRTIAITGSVGKTSVKEMCGAILAKKGKVLVTQGNFNNEIGVPHTLMRLDDSYDYAVIELGANHIGEIAYTTDLTQPDVAVLNNVGKAHLEGFGSIEGVVQAKGEIFNGLSDDGVAIVNGDSEYKSVWLNKLQQQLPDPNNQIVQFNHHQQDVSQQFWCSDIELDSLGKASFTLYHNQTSVKIQLPMPGKHNVFNALAAAAACSQLGMSLDDIADGLSDMAEVKGRVNLLQLNDNLLVIDDSYNANVKSVEAAIDLLATYQSDNVFIFGDMGELGDEAVELHQQIGLHAADKQLSEVICLGEFSRHTANSFGEKGKHFTEQNKLNEYLHGVLTNKQQKVTVLVKGSRSAKMERVVEYLSSCFSSASDNNNKG